MANLSFIGPPAFEDEAPPSGGGAAPQGDPSADLVTELLGQLEMEPEPQKPQVGGGKMFLGILGDALLAMGKARAGQPVGPGPFTSSLAERERMFREQEAQADIANRQMRNQVRIAEFEQRLRTKQPTEQAPVDLDTTSESIVGSQEMANAGIIPQDAVGQPVRMRVSTNPTTGQIVNRQMVGMGFEEPDKPKTHTFPGIISADDVASNPSMKAHVGERWMFHATEDPKTGVFTDIRPVKPVGDAMQFIETPTGFVTVGRTTGQVGEPIDPDTGERIVSHGAMVKEIELRNEERARKLGKDLTEKGIETVATSGAGIDAVSWAMRRYHELGGPQLIISNKWVTSKEAKQARAAVSAAVLPVRRWLFGAALTESEKASAEDILTNMESSIHPDQLEANMVEIANLMWRERRNRLDVENRAGRNTSNFGFEMENRIFKNSEDLMFDRTDAIEDLPTDEGDAASSSKLSSGLKIIVKDE